jgi:DNA-binding NarL/FixJ family response regulator
MVAGPAALTGIIAELFGNRPEFEVVAFAPGLRGLARKAARVAPDLIVAHIKPIGTGVRAAVESIKRASPRSKLVVICAVPDFMQDARRCGADACVKQEQLVAALLPAVTRISKRPLS